MVDSPEHNLAKWLDSLIKPYVPDTYSLLSTSSFIEEIKILKPRNDIKLLNFDVTSLFTNDSVGLAIDDIAKKLFSCDVAFEFPFPQSKTLIRQNIFKKHLKLNTKGMFIHNGKLFSQIDSIAIGKPLDPTLVNLFLGMIEKNYSSHFKKEPFQVSYDENFRSTSFVLFIISCRLPGRCICDH